jgi:hypothetical protein
VFDCKSNGRDCLAAGQPAGHPSEGGPQAQRHPCPGDGVRTGAGEDRGFARGPALSFRCATEFAAERDEDALTSRRGSVVVATMRQSCARTPNPEEVGSVTPFQRAHPSTCGQEWDMEASD